MPASALIEVKGKPRSAEVTISAKPTGLWIQVKLPQQKAEAIAGRAGSKARAKARASKAILSALNELMKEEKRDRSGSLQGDIPMSLKAELSRLADEVGGSLTSMLQDRLSEWIDGRTGELKMKTSKSGSRTRVGPRNYRVFAGEARIAYADARKAGELGRLEVEVGGKTSKKVNSLLAVARVSKALFLTALAQDVVTSKRRDVAGLDEHRTQIVNANPASPGAVAR